MDGNGCWVWQLAQDGNGYGKCARRGRRGGHQKAHRYYYEQRVGPIPEGLELDHLCRNRLCVNPAHLEPVTHLENAHRGSCTKLSQAQVAEIRSAQGSTRAIGKRYGVSGSHVCAIQRGYRSVA